MLAVLSIYLDRLTAIRSATDTAGEFFNIGAQPAQSVPRVVDGANTIRRANRSAYGPDFALFQKRQL